MGTQSASMRSSTSTPVLSLLASALCLSVAAVLFFNRGPASLSSGVAVRAGVTSMPRVGAYSQAGIKNHHVARRASMPACMRGQRRSMAVPAEASDYWLRDQAAQIVDEEEAQEFSHMDAEFWNDIVRRDERGLPEDVSTSVSSSARNLHAILGEVAEGPRLLSMAFELDPMPWWTFSDFYMRLNILKEYADTAETPEKNVLVYEDKTYNFENEKIDLGPNWQVLKLTQKTKKGDLVSISCNFGYIGDPEPRQMRARAKEWYSGGMDTVDLSLFPVHKLDEECRGSSADLNNDEVLAYPMPQWMREAGYKGTANLAITGCSGTGKSSFMNCLRGLDPKDEGAAKVGNVETTMIATPFTFTDAACQLLEDGSECSAREHFRLWDLPGAGTPKFPLNNYLRVMGIKYFDLVIVIAAGRFTETDLTLMKEMSRNGVPYFAIRTKIDLEIENAMWDMELDEEETMEVIREDLRP